MSLKRMKCTGTYWNVKDASVKLMELATATMMDVVKVKVEYEFESEWKNDEAASAHLRVPASNRNVCWEAVRMDIEA
jgi:hypothetical protein